MTSNLEDQGSAANQKCQPQQDPTLADNIRRGLLIGLAVSAVVFLPAIGSEYLSSSAPPAIAAPVSAPDVRFADFSSYPPSPDARHVADWIADSRDNAGFDFVIVDKKYATVYVFDASARLRGASPVLLGAAPGDDSVPGIGQRPIAEVQLPERTTPAGRFMGERGRNAVDEDVVWVDYDAAVSMHRVRVTDPKEQRLERLATPTHTDNRISYGCINIPVAFYEEYVRPTFATHKAVVYVLPEIKSAQQVFGSYNVATAKRGRSADQARNQQ